MTSPRSVPLNLEDVCNRLTQRYADATAQLVVAESTRDAALKENDELRVIIENLNAKVSELGQQLTTANRALASAKDEREAAVERFQLAAGPNTTAYHADDCALDLDHPGGCVPSADDEPDDPRFYSPDPTGSGDPSHG